MTDSDQLQSWPEQALSSERLATYFAATGGDANKALALYTWNAQVSAALMIPLHFAEVVTRNAAHEALVATYGEEWPWQSTFEYSLPSYGDRYSPRDDLQKTRDREETTGKVVAELSFAFWPALINRRHDEIIWRRQLLKVFPYHEGIKFSELRTQISDYADDVRQLRNRVAHHEPIFRRDLALDLSKMKTLVNRRSRGAAAWMQRIEGASRVIENRPR